MKNKLIIIGMLLVAIISSCTVPRYLPTSEEIDVNQFGSYINVNHIIGSNIKGELIAIDSSKLIVLIDSNSIKKAVAIPIKEIISFKLWYAKPKNYGYAIPIYTLATISHGWYSIFSAPVNLIVTISVTASGASAFQYSDKEMTYEKLKMFARFPQGIPPHIDLVCKFRTQGTTFSGSN